MLGPAVGLTVGAVMTLTFGIVYRLNRKRVQAHPYSPEDIEEMRLRIQLLPPGRKGPALEQLRIRQDWRYSLKRERAYLTIAGALFVAAVVVLFL